MQVNMLEAKNCLYTLFDVVERDEEVIITRKTTSSTRYGY